MGKLSVARIKANKKWEASHRERAAYINKRSAAKNFILKLATQEDLISMENYIEERKKYLQKAQNLSWHVPF